MPRFTTIWGWTGPNRRESTIRENLGRLRGDGRAARPSCGKAKPVSPSVGSKLMEAPMLLIPVMVLTTVVLWMAAIFAVPEQAKQEPRRLFGCG